MPLDLSAIAGAVADTNRLEAQSCATIKSTVVEVGEAVNTQGRISGRPVGDGQSVEQRGKRSRGPPRG